MSISCSLGQLATRLGAELRGGDPERNITGIASLDRAGPQQLSFFASRRYRNDLAETRAGAVLIGPQEASLCPVPCLVTADPYLQYARASQWFERPPLASPGVHSDAVVAEDAEIAPSASIGPQVSIASGAVIGPDTLLEAGVRIAEGVRVGRGSRLRANVSVARRVSIGERCLIHSGTVLGCDGFGFAPGPEGWEKIAQLGSVSIDDDVEIGACCTIDAGALENTKLGRGVKLDNQVHVGHNVQIGEHTVIVAGTLIGGSVRIGAYCQISGNVSIVNGVCLADEVIIGPGAIVAQSIEKAGRYDSMPPLLPHVRWRRNYHWSARLQTLFGRLRALEKHVGT